MREILDDLAGFASMVFTVIGSLIVSLLFAAVIAVGYILAVVISLLPYALIVAALIWLVSLLFGG